jgi:phosphatidylserine decarboxylase
MRVCLLQPFASLDIIEVFTSFIDTLVQVYARLSAVESYAAIPNVSLPEVCRYDKCNYRNFNMLSFLQAMDAFHKFDTRLKHYFTKPITLQLQQIAAKKVKGTFYSAKARISHVHTEVPAVAAPALSPESDAAENKPARPEEDALSQASTQNTAETPATFTTQQQVLLTGGFVFAAASATAALRASAEAQLAASAHVAGGVGVVLDSNILCGLAHATAETRDLSADVVAGEDLAEGTKSPEADAATATATAGSAPADAAAAGTKSTRNLLGGWSGGGKPAAALLSSKPPTPQETAKQQAAARAQLGAYFGGASGVKAGVKPGKAAPV